MFTLPPGRILLLLFCLCIAPASAQYWNWHTDEPLANGSATCSPQAVAADNSGNVFISGSFMGSVTIGASAVSALGGGDMYLVKYSASGQPQWTVQFGATTTGNEQVYAIATDTSGNVYVGGYAPDPFTVGSVSVNPSGPRGFVLKFDGNGTCLWSRMLGSANLAYPQKMVYDAPGNRLIVGGTYWQNGTFGSFSLTGLGVQDAYVAALGTATGNVVWASGVATSTGTETVSGLALDNWGNIFVAGAFGSSTVTIGSQVLGFPNAGWYAAKFRSTGSYVNCFTSMYLDFAGLGFSMANGHLYAAGRYYQAFTEGLISLPHLGQNMQGDGFACAFDTLLQPLFYTSFNGPGNDNVHALLVDSGNFYIALEARGQMVCQAHMLNSTGQNYGMVYAKLDQGLSYQWSRAISGSYFSNRLTGLASGGGYLYLTGKYRNSIVFDNGNQVFYTLSSPPNSTTFLVQLNDIQLIETGHLDGWVFRDDDADGVIGTSETVRFKQRLLSNATNGTYSATDSYGNYSFSAMPGMQQLSVLNIPSYYTQVFPTQQTLNVSLPPFSFTDSVNFGLQPVPGIQDLGLTLTGLPSLRAGNTTRYYIDYENYGTDTMTGYIELDLDTQLNFLQAVPPPDSVSGDRVYWGFSGLLPLGTGHIHLDCGVSPLSPLSAVVYNYAVIEPVAGDTVPEDNYDTTRQIITGPYDPNMKAVIPEGAITPADVAGGIWLDYTLHFQNVGTDTAFNVVIRDTLSSLLDIATLQVIGSSAAVELSVASNLELVFRFDSILLPDSSTNQPGSNGYVRYRIRPLPTVTVGQQIDNTCYIFFDYNMPVQTNTTETPVQVITALTDSYAQQAIAIYPNPCSDQFVVESTSSIESIIIYDLSGKEIRAIPGGLHQLRVSVADVPSGIMFVKVTSSTENTYFKIIKTGTGGY